MDFKGEADLKKADPFCKHCYGTGIVGRIFAQGRAQFAKGVDLICRCVPKASVEASPKTE
jgi:hypothetical protein